MPNFFLFFFSGGGGAGRGEGTEIIWNLMCDVVLVLEDCWPDGKMKASGDDT